MIRRHYQLRRRRMVPAAAGIDIWPPVYKSPPSIALGACANCARHNTIPADVKLAGSLAQCRIFSRYLALQIKALEEGLLSGDAHSQHARPDTPHQARHAPMRM
jgi:hypothetical protein